MIDRGDRFAKSYGVESDVCAWAYMLHTSPSLNEDSDADTKSAWAKEVADRLGAQLGSSRTSTMDGAPKPRRRARGHHQEVRLDECLGRLPQPLGRLPYVALVRRKRITLRRGKYLCDPTNHLRDEARREVAPHPRIPVHRGVEVLRRTGFNHKPHVASFVRARASTLSHNSPRVSPASRAATRRAISASHAAALSSGDNPSCPPDGGRSASSTGHRGPGRLPPDAHEHAVADQILLNCRRVVGQEPSQIPEEQEFIVFMQNTWEQARDDGRMEEAARSVLTALRVRGIEVPDAARKRILAEKDRERLERWLERAILASSIVDVLNVPS